MQYFLFSCHPPRGRDFLSRHAVVKDISGLQNQLCGKSLDFKGFFCFRLFFACAIEREGGGQRWRGKTWREPMLRFLLLPANTIRYTFLSPQIHPASDLVGPGAQNNGRAGGDAGSFTSSCFRSHQNGEENQRAVLTALDKHRERPCHTSHWFSTEKIIWFHIKIIWRPLLCSGHNDSGMSGMNGPFDQPLLWPPGLTLEGCVTPVAEPHFNMKTIYLKRDSLDGEQNSSTSIYSSINAGQ